jgi:hypothetical protein
MELKENEEIKKMIPRPNAGEYIALRESIRKEGQKVPIEVMADGTIIDGYTRFQVCRELNIEPKYVVLEDIKTIEEAKKYAYAVNFARRNLNPFQRCELIYNGAYQEEKKKAEERQKSGIPYPHSAGKVGEATELAVEGTGISHATFERAVKIIEEAPDWMIEKLRLGEMSIIEAYETIRVLDKVPLKKHRQYLLNKVKAGELRNRDVKKIVTGSQGVNALLETIPQDGVQQILDDYIDGIPLRDMLYTEKMKNPNKILKLVSSKINSKYGLETQERMEIETEIWNNEQEARDWASKYAGTLLEKKTIWVFDFPKQKASEVKEIFEKIEKAKKKAKVNRK